MLKEKLKQLFIPSKENGYKPNFLERFSMGVMLILVILSFTITNLQALLWISSDWMVSTILPSVIVDLTNEERGTESLTTLRRNDTLDRAAELKAKDMAKYEYFAHYSPAGVSPWYWFDEVGYGFIHAGENLAVHFTDSSDVVHAWMESPTHRANIMNGNYTEIGVGTAKGEYKGFQTVFVVQLFGTPAAKADEPAESVAGAVLANAPDITVESVTIPPAEEEKPATEAIAPATFETVEDATATPDGKTTEPVSSGEPVVPDDSVPVSGEEVAENIQQTDEVVVLYSDLATSSRPGVPALIESQGNDTPPVNPIAKTATQPRLILQIIYGILAAIVTIALILSIVIEWRRQNPVQIAYATAMLILMAVLLQVHTALTSGATIV